VLLRQGNDFYPVVILEVTGVLFPVLQMYWQ
jgi:hypothetical protein